MAYHQVMCHMPAVCEEKGLPYVYTPSRFKRARLCLFLKTCKYIMMPKRDYLALAACVTQLLSNLLSSGKTWELPWAWREAVWWWWCESMKTTRSCMTKLKQRSKLCPRPSSVDMWTVSLSRQIACICDLGMLSCLSKIWDVCSCFWTSFFSAATLW